MGSLKDSGGYTLLELVIVFSLMTTMAMIIAPPTADAFNRIALRSAANEVETAHEYARTLAIQYGRTTKLEIYSGASGRDAERTSGILAIRADTTTVGEGKKDWAAWWNRLPTVRRSRLNRGRLISDRSAVCFDARGLATIEADCQDPAATIVVRVGSRADTLRFSPFGQLLR